MSEVHEATDAQIVRSSAVVGIGTALSRITGTAANRRPRLRRSAASRFADAYNLANTTPNIVYDLILGGVLSATLVPVFVDRFQHDDDDGVNAVVTVVTSALIGLTVAALLAAPWIFRAYTWASPSDNAAELERAGVPLLRLFVPQILFYGLMALGTAILNARRRFAAPAFAPILNNSSSAVCCCCSPTLAGRGASVQEVLDHPSWLWLLGAGTTAGIVVMTDRAVAVASFVRLALSLAVPAPRPGGAQGRRAVRLDARLRDRQPGRAAHRARAGGPRRRRCRRPSISTRSSSSSCPTGCSRCR